MRQNSKILKKINCFVILKIRRYVEKLRKSWNCVFLQVSATPLKWAPPPKGGGVPKIRQNSKFLKKKFYFFFILKIRRYVEKLRKSWNCVFCKFQPLPLKWAPPPKGGGVPKMRQSSKFLKKKFFIFFI